jgi:hypothetical protein
MLYLIDDFKFAYANCGTLPGAKPLISIFYNKSEIYLFFPNKPKMLKLKLPSSVDFQNSFLGIKILLLNIFI